MNFGARKKQLLDHKIVPSNKMTGELKTLVCVLVSAISFGVRIIETDAATINKAKSSIMANAFVTMMPSNSNRLDGIAGTNTFRVRKTAIMEGMPNTKAVLKSIRPVLYFGIAPTKLLKPTINSE
jgi:hypothetical protein